MDTAALRPRTMAMMLAVGGIFGSSFLFVKLLVAEMSPAQVTAWRLLFGAAAMLAILAWRSGVRFPSAPLLLKAGVLTMLDSVLPNTLLAWAQIRIDSSIAAVIISSMPLFTVLFAIAIPGSERLSAAKVGGLALGIAGVAILVGADAQSATSGSVAAHLAAVLAAMSNAAAVLYARSLLAKEDALELSAVKLVVGAALAIAIVGVTGGGDAVPSMGVGSWCALVTLGVLSNAVGRSTYLSLIAAAGSVRASLVAYIVPVVAVLLGWVVLGERASPGAGAGIALIAVGIAAVTHGPLLAERIRTMARLERRQRVNEPVTERLPAARHPDDSRDRLPRANRAVGGR